MLGFLTMVALARPLLGDDATTQPAGTLIEAEDHVGSDSVVVADEKASGGKYVENAKAWQPLVSIDVPKDAPDPVTIYVRQRGGPIQLKVVKDGKQIEKDWIWDKPTDFTWTKMATLSRADLGEKFILMRGDGADKVAVDAVVLSDKAPQGMLPPDHPDDAARPATASFQVNWDRTIGALPAQAWGINDYEITDPQHASDVEYNRLLAGIAPPIIRIHHADLLQNWLNADQTHWDVAKIRACFAAAATGYRGAKLLINLGGWPHRMSAADGTLDPGQLDAYSALCAEAVRVFRDDLKLAVDGWEPFNECDKTYDRAGKLDELWATYNAVAKAMRAADPAARIGGPALTWAKPEWVNGFVQNCLPQADFVTYHSYGVGEVTDSNEQLFARLDAIDSDARSIRQAVDSASPTRHVPIYLDEYNVKWTWDPIERRHGNAIGAVFQAGVVRHAMLAGIDAAMLWHFKGNAYGIVDENDQPRLTYPLYQWAKNRLVGQIVECSASSPDLVEPLAIRRADGKATLLLIVKADRSLTVPDLRGLFSPTTSLEFAQVASGQATDFVPLDSALTHLPGYSLTVICER